MAIEQLPSSPEQEPAASHEKQARHPQERAEVAERSESDHTKEIETAREKVQHTALEARQYAKTAEKSHREPPTKQTKQVLYKQTLKRMQHELPSPLSRNFSKLIHQPLVEKTSDVAAKTIFRPSLTLGASVGALFGGTVIYLVARTYGFTLPRSSFLVCALLGAILGLALEGLRALWRNRFRRSST